jgi:hypothetical protein
VRQAETQKQAADGAVTAQLPETYQWLLVPEQKTPQSTVDWHIVRLSGSDALAVRASKKLRNDESLVINFGSTILRKHLDDVPLWRGEHVAVRQLVEDFACYLYLPRLAGPEVLVQAIRDGVAMLTWQSDTFAYAESHDEAAGRYRGLHGGQMVSVSPESAALLVKPDVARRQMDAEIPPAVQPEVPPVIPPGKPGEIGTSVTPPKPTPLPRRFHGSVTLDTARVGRDAGRVAEEVIAHLSGLVAAHVTVTLEIEASIPSGTPDHVVRTVTENSRTLKFTQHGFEEE